MSNKLFIVLFILLYCSDIFGLRVNKPFKLNYPIDEGQIVELNKYLEDLWNIQNGRQEIDIVTSTKSDAKNGEIWILNSGGIIKLQTKAGGTIYSVTMSP